MDFNPLEDLENRLRLLREQGLRLEDELKTLRDRPDRQPALNGEAPARLTDPEPRHGSAAPPPKAPQKGGRRILAKLAIVPVAIVLIAVGLRVWNYLSSYEATDDAQIDGHIAPISSRIAGTISRVYVKDTQMVEGGQLIAEIDPRDEQAAVDNARANLAQALAQVESARADYQAALSKIREDEAAGVLARNDASRSAALYGERVVAKADYDQKTSAAAVNQAVVASDRASANSAQTVIASKEAAANATQAALNQALLNLGYTRIMAPMSGVVGKKSVEVGEQVEQGEQLLAIVPLNDIWVTANFKETQLRKIRPGQRVTIAVDATGTAYEGSVDGMAAASGDRYSLLPPENATGNYVKVVQRLPIRIRLEPGQDPMHRLRPGMSAEPTVWLR
jgi:membrane fusion protein, multidrug efflux system